MFNNSQTINISTSTILRVILILLGAVFLYIIRDVLVMVFVAIIIAASLNGPANWLQKHRIHRVLGVVFIYLILLSLLALVIFLILPPLSEQIKNLVAVFPEYMGKIGLSVAGWWEQYGQETPQSFLTKLGERLTQAASSIFTTTVGVFGGLVSALITLVISFYLTVQEKGIKKFLMSLTPINHQPYVSDLVERIQVKMGSWLRGQLLIAVIIGILVYIGLTILGVKYALVLALTLAVLELIPYIGPILAAIPAVILAFFQEPFLALLVILLYIIVQQLENHIIAPQIMRRAVGLNPIIIIIVMLIGAQLAGVLGLILAVPVTAAIAEFLKDISKREA